MSKPPIFEFDDFRLDPNQRLLFKNGRDVPLDPQTFEVLRVLIQHNLEYPGAIISKDELLIRAWGKNKFPTNQALAYHLSTLRSALGDDANNPRYIETLRKRGCRFLLPIRMTGDLTEAVRFFLKGRHFWHHSTAESNQRAISCYEEAIALDPRYGSAYAAIAESWILLGTFAHQRYPTAEAMMKAEEAALKALEINDNIAEAHSALASVEALFRWNWTNAESDFQRAIKLAGNPMVKAWYGLCLAARRDWQKANSVIQEAIDRAPTSFLLYALSGRISYIERNYEQAILSCEQGIYLESHFYLCYLFLGHVLRACQKYDEALTAFEKAKLLTDDKFGSNPVILAEFGHLWGLLGEKKKGLDLLDVLKQSARHRYVSPHVFAHIYLGLGDYNKALEYLELTYEDRGAYLIFLDTDPIYDPLRNNAHFTDLVRRVGFSRFC